MIFQIDKSTKNIYYLIIDNLLFKEPIADFCPVLLCVLCANLCALCDKAIFFQSQSTQRKIATFAYFFATIAIKKLCVFVSSCSIPNFQLILLSSQTKIANIIINV